MFRKYPIGLQSFQEIRRGGYIYIDKTEIIHQMVETGKYYFLSRPRRFGKSLLVDTMEELFSGSKELFEGLWIHDKWDWTKTNPVIHISFAKLPYKEVGLQEAINRGISRNAKRLGVDILGDNIKDCFIELIEKASVKGKVVILVDEYDKPILDFMDDPEQIEANRSILKSFYSILKDSDKYIRLLFITGISQFSKVSIFSDLNNLRNITLAPQFGSITGITQQELEQGFAPEILELKKEKPDILAQIKQWYNGYTWNMKDWVYNPFSVLNFMANTVFEEYWFETGTPDFLFRILKNHSIYDVESFRLSRLSLSTFNPENPNIGSLLFQTGYVTIKDITAEDQLYTLGFPNREVKASLLDGLLSIYRGKENQDNLAIIVDLKASIKNGDVDGIIRYLNAMISDIAYDYWRPDTESIFTIITSIIFKKVGMDVATEVHSAKGRCDILVKTPRYIYVLALKLDGSAAAALDQIKQMGYLAPFAQDPRKKLAVGISFSSEKRAVAEYEVEQL